MAKSKKVMHESKDSKKRKLIGVVVSVVIVLAVLLIGLNLEETGQPTWEYEQMDFPDLSFEPSSCGTSGDCPSGFGCIDKLCRKICSEEADYCSNMGECYSCNYPEQSVMQSSKYHPDSLLSHKYCLPTDSECVEGEECNDYGQCVEEESTESELEVNILFPPESPSQSDSSGDIENLFDSLSFYNPSDLNNFEFDVSYTGDSSFNCQYILLQLPCVNCSDSSSVEGMFYSEEREFESGGNFVESLNSETFVNYSPYYGSISFEEIELGKFYSLKVSCEDEVAEVEAEDFVFFGTEGVLLNLEADCEDDSNCPELFVCVEGECKCGYWEGEDYNYLSNNYVDGYSEKMPGDECLSGYSNKVVKYYCNYSEDPNGIKKSKTIKCEDSDICYDGACRSCIDYDSSDYIGPDHFVGGGTWNATYDFDEGFLDSCDGNILNEYYCDGGNIVNETINCSYEYNNNSVTGYVCEETPTGGACVCKTDWDKGLTPSCATGDYRVIQWDDENNCCEDYEQVVACDYQETVQEGGDGVMWGDNQYGLEDAEENVLIGGELFDPDSSYYVDANPKVEIFGENDSYEYSVSFNHDFMEFPLNLINVDITSANEDDSWGYVFINELEATDKTLIFDRRRTDTDSVCIKDIPGKVPPSEFGDLCAEDVSKGFSLEDFSNDCNATDENLVLCDGVSHSGYRCNLVNNGAQFKVESLNHSGVVEWYSGEGLGECVPDWNCTNWSECSNGMQYRNCTDLNNCGLEPTESQTCSSNNQGEFPDTNNTSTDDVEEETPDSKAWIWILVILGILVIAFLVVLFVAKGKQNQEEAGEDSEVGEEAEEYGEGEYEDDYY